MRLTKMMTGIMCLIIFFDVPGLNDTGVITQKIPGNHKKDRDCNADYAVYPIGVEAVYMGMNDKKSA